MGVLSVLRELRNSSAWERRGLDRVRVCERRWGRWKVWGTELRGQWRVLKEKRSKRKTARKKHLKEISDWWKQAEQTFTILYCACWIESSTHLRNHALTPFCCAPFNFESCHQEKICICAHSLANESLFALGVYVTEIVSCGFHTENPTMTKQWPDFPQVQFHSSSHVISAAQKTSFTSR